MHIALYHDAVIPPTTYGGTERVVYWLAKGLLELGHQITLVARHGSHVPGATLCLFEKGCQETNWQSRLPSDVELIHYQATPKTPSLKPYLVTIHGCGQPGEVFLPNTVFISKAHARNHNSSFYVYNGIDPNEYPCEKNRDEYLVFLAKASWRVKNLAGAIELARGAQRPLYVMGSREWPWRLQRRLPAYRGVHYLGMVDDTEKRHYLRRAYALLFPVRWPEPFGIALTESLASGCAVFGTPYGSLPEIVTPDVGVLSNDAETLIQGIRSFQFKPEDCRTRVYQGFTHLDMAKHYVQFYRSVLAQGLLISPEYSPRSNLPTVRSLPPYHFCSEQSLKQ